MENLILLLVILVVFMIATDRVFLYIRQRREEKKITKTKLRVDLEVTYMLLKSSYLEETHFLPLCNKIYSIYRDSKDRKMILLYNGIRIEEHEILELNPQYKSYFTPKNK